MKSFGFKLCIVPVWSITSRDSTKSQVSWPKEPAFITRAPPIDPGIPEKNAAGPNLFFSANNAKTLPEAPDSTLPEYSASIFILFRDFLMEITEPLIPPSLNKTLVPLPNHVIGLSWFDFKNCDNSSRLLGMKKVSAGPPTFHDVCIDYGSL